MSNNDCPICHGSGEILMLTSYVPCECRAQIPDRSAQIRELVEARWSDRFGAENLAQGSRLRKILESTIAIEAYHDTQMRRWASSLCPGWEVPLKAADVTATQVMGYMAAEAWLADQ